MSHTVPNKVYKMMLEFKSVRFDFLLDLPKELFTLILRMTDTSSIFSLSHTSKHYVTYLQKSVLFQVDMTSVHKDAILNGHTSLFKWLIPDQHQLPSHLNMFDKLMKWMIPNDYQCDKSNNYPCCKMCSTIHTKMSFCMEAAKSGSFEILQYVYDKSAFCSPTNTIIESIFEAAIRGGSLEILEFIYDDTKNTYQYKDNRRYICVASGLGYLEILKWLRQIGCSWNVHAVSCAADKGHLEVLQYLHENNCSTGCDACSSAAYGGQFETLKWLRQNGYAWSNWTCLNAVRGGHFEILKWLHENGCPWDEWSCSVADRTGQFEILQWLHENGCPCAIYGCELCKSG